MAPITQLSQLDLKGNYTYTDYRGWKFPQYVEMVNGRVLPPMPGRSPQHQHYLLNLMVVVDVFLKSQPGEMVQIPFDVCPAYRPGQSDEQILTVVQPDLIVVRDPARLAERGCFGAPDWVLEILSPGFVSRDTKTKFDLYQESGVREYWIMFPGINTVMAYVLENERYELAAEYAAPGPMPVATLPGLAVEWADVFDDFQEPGFRP